MWLDSREQLRPVTPSADVPVESGLHSQLERFRIDIAHRLRGPVRMEIVLGQYPHLRDYHQFHLRWHTNDVRCRDGVALNRGIAKSQNAIGEFMVTRWHYLGTLIHGQCLFDTLDYIQKHMLGLLMVNEDEGRLMTGDRFRRNVCMNIYGSALGVDGINIWIDRHAESENRGRK